MADRSSIVAGRGHVVLGVDSDPLTRGLNAAASRMQLFGAKIASIGTSIAAIGSALSAPFLASLYTFSSYEQALANLRAAANPTAEEFASLKTVIEQVAAATGEGLPEVTEAFSELVKAGVSVRDVTAGLGEEAVQFARVGMMPMAQAASVLVQGLNTFRTEGVTASQVMNTISSAADSSLASIQGISDGFANVGPVAASSNQSMRDVATALAILNDRGIMGAEAGTSLRNVLTRLTTGSDGASEALQTLNVSAYGANGQVRPLIDIIDDLNRATTGMNPERQNRLLFQLAGAYGQVGLRALMSGGQGRQVWDQMQQSMGQNLSVADKFAQMMDTLTGVAKRFWVQIQLAAVGVGESLAPAIRAIASVMFPVLDVVQQLIRKYSEWFSWTAAIGAVLVLSGTALAAFGYLAMGVAAGLSAIVGVIVFLKALFLTVFSPAVIAIGLVAAAIYALYYYFDDVTGAVSQLWTALRESPFGQFAIDVAKVAMATVALAGTIATLGGYLVYLGAQWAAIKWWEGVQILWGWFKDLYDVVSDFVSEAHDQFRQLYGPLIEFGGRLFDNISTILSNTAARFSEAFSNIVGFAGEGFAGIKEAFNEGNFQAIWDIAKIVAQMAWNEMTFFAEATWNEWADAIKDTFGACWLVIQSGAILMWGRVKEIAFSSLAAIAEGMAAIGGPMEAVLRSQAALFRTQAIQASTGAAASVRDLQDQSQAEADVEQGLRWERDDAMQEEMDAGRMQGVGDIDAIRRQLEKDRQIRDADAVMFDLLANYEESAERTTNNTAGRPAGEGSDNKSSAMGTFSRDALAGFFGGVAGETEEQRLMREQRDLLRDIAARRGVVMA